MSCTEVIDIAPTSKDGDRPRHEGEQHDARAHARVGVVATISDGDRRGKHEVQPRAAGETQEQSAQQHSVASPCRRA